MAEDQLQLFEHLRPKTLGESLDEFIEAFDGVRDPELCIKLIHEEYDEVTEAFQEWIDDPTNETRRNLLKELADLAYVVTYMARAQDMDFDEGFRRVHESNMSKTVDGKAIKNEQGKVLKGPNYKKPDLTDCV